LLSWRSPWWFLWWWWWWWWRLLKKCVRVGKRDGDYGKQNKGEPSINARSGRERNNEGKGRRRETLSTPR